MRRLNWLEVHAWATYDFAYTIWSMNILSVYFQLYVIKDLKSWIHWGQVAVSPDLEYSLTLSMAMAVVALLSPILGAWSDRQGRRIPHLAFWCLVCVLATATLARSSGVLSALGLFFVACLGFQLAQVFYNAKLPEITTPETIGRVSGYGISLGFVGSIVGMLAVMPFVTGKLLIWHTGLTPAGNRGAFLPTALLFLAFALPCFFLIREGRSPEDHRPTNDCRPLDWKRTWTDLWAGTYPGLARFLLANLLFFDAVNTVIGFMSTYTVQVFGFDAQRGEVQILLISATVWAVAGAASWGFLCDRLSAKRTLSLCLALWTVAFLAALTVRSKTQFFWIVGPLAGICMGGTGVAARPLLAQLVPGDRQGEFFGLWSLFGRLAAITGPLIWGIIVSALQGWGTARYRFAMGAELIMLLAGLALLQGVSIRQSEARKIGLSR